MVAGYADVRANPRTWHGSGRLEVDGSAKPAETRHAILRICHCAYDDEPYRRASDTAASLS